MTLDASQQEQLYQMRRRHALICLCLGIVLIIPALLLNIASDQVIQAIIRTGTLFLTTLSAIRVYRVGVDRRAAVLGLTASGIGTLLALSVLGGLHAPMAMPLLISYVAFVLASFGEDYRRFAVSGALIGFVVLAGIELTGHGDWVEHRVSNEATMRANQVIGLSIVFGATLLYGFLMLRWIDLKSHLLNIANEQLAQEANNLEQLQRKKDALFSIVSHELRTPAATIHMLAEQSQGGNDNRTHILETTNHLLNVIDDLRTTINLDEAPQPKPGHFSLIGLVNEVERQVSSICSRKHIRLVTNIAPGQNDVFYADAYRIRSMLTNLIRNAANHSNGTEIRFAIASQPESNGQSLVTCSVADNGVGIDPADRERIFSPFERGMSQATGTGVGLHIVKTWSEALGGSVVCQDSDMGGAEFLVALPLPHGDPAELEDSAAAPGESLLERMRGKVVLLVEDDPMISRITRQMLERQLELNVTTAADGQQGFELWSEGEFDLIISDYFMPHMDGCEMVRAIRAAGGTLPIIGVTAATIGPERNDLQQAGAAYVLAKPIKMNELEPVLNALFP